MIIFFLCFYYCCISNYCCNFIYTYRSCASIFRVLVNCLFLKCYCCYYWLFLNFGVVCLCVLVMILDFLFVFMGVFGDVFEFDLMLNDVVVD